MENQNISAKGQQKLTNVYILLASLFVGNALLAELISSKIFSVSALFHLPFTANVSLGVIIWPLVFVLSDIVNEYFGRRGVRFISFITAGIVAYSSFILLAGSLLPPARFWMDIYKTDPAGNPFNINYAYSVIFRQSIGIIIGSLTAFLMSQFLDAYVFFYFRKKTGHKLLWLRATGSTVISQVVDSFVVLFVAFYIFGPWPMDQILKVGAVQYFYKVSLAIILTPLIYVMHHFIDKYLSHETHELTGEQ